MDSTKRMYPQEVITPEESDFLTSGDEGHSPAWLERELADTAAWIESNLHQFRAEVRPLLSRFAGNLREAAESARNTQDIIRADARRGSSLPGRMGPLEREVRGLALWLCGEARRNTFDGREKRLIQPLYRHVFSIAGQCAELEQFAQPGQTEDVADIMKSLNLRPGRNDEE